MLPGTVPWPAEVAERYRSRGLWRGLPLDSLLTESAHRSPAATAVVADDGRLNYADLEDAVDRRAAGWAAAGIADRDRVVVHLPNSTELIVTVLSLVRRGAIPVLALPAHRLQEVRHVARASGAVAYVGCDLHERFDQRALADELLAEVDDLTRAFIVGDPGHHRPLPTADPVARPAVDPSDVALFLLSGGTTGAPKLIARTHDDYLCNVSLSAANAGLGPDDVYLAALPMAHNYALACPGVLGTLQAGGTVVVGTDADPERALELVGREGVTVTGLVPPLAIEWTDAVDRLRPDLSSLRLVQVGGSRFAPGPARRFVATLGVRLQQSFGMAEGLLSQSAPDDPEEVRVTAQGRPICVEDEVRVVDQHDRPVPAGERGLLQVRGPYTPRGYFAAPDVNARAFTTDGFFRTGDVVRRTLRGDLVVEGRVTDVVNRGGEKVACDELEEHLLAHDAVRDAAVVPLPDPRLGERTCAVVVAAGDRPPRRGSLARFLAERGLAGYKIPDVVEIVPALPRTAAGKVDKVALRRELAGRGDRS